MTGRDLFQLRVPEDRANPSFLAVAREPAYLAARRLMNNVFSDFVDRDHSFIVEFQTDGFHARVWELSLFAFLFAAKFELSPSVQSPDFVALSPHAFSIEAVTTNTTLQRPLATTADSIEAAFLPEDVYLARDEHVYRVANAIDAKLNKRFDGGLAYWQLEHTRDRPFIIAIQCFHDESSLFLTSSGLASYLFGLESFASRDDAGNLAIADYPVQTHQFGGRTVESGLFASEHARCLSAVIFSNGATIAQFQRIGTELGLGAEDVTVIRSGTCHDPDPNADQPKQFGYLVEAGKHREDFRQVLHVIHNPNAAVPMPLEVLSGVTQSYMTPSGQIATIGPEFRPFQSVTQILTVADGTGSAEPV